MGLAPHGAGVPSHLHHAPHLLQAQPPLQHHHHGRRRYRRSPLSGPVPHPGVASALPPDRLGAGLVRGHAHAHLLLPLPVPAHRHHGLVHPLRDSLQDGDGPGGLRSPRGRLRPGQAVAGAQAVPHHGRGLRDGLPPHGELLHLRRQHPQHPGGRVRLHAQLRPGVPVPGHHVSRHGEAALQHALRAQLPHPDGSRPLAHRDHHRAGDASSLGCCS